MFAHIVFTLTFTSLCIAIKLRIFDFIILTTLYFFPTCFLPIFLPLGETELIYMVSVKTIPTEGATNGAASLTPVQDLWENSFKKIGDENPEQTVTGMLLFYPHQLVGYLEVSEIKVLNTLY